jgi:hypothetical protein
MGLNDLVSKAKDLIAGHKDQVDEGVDKAADLAKEKVGHDEQVDKAAEFVKDKLDDAAGE